MDGKLQQRSFDTKKKRPQLIYSLLSYVSVAALTAALTATWVSRSEKKGQKFDSQAVQRTDRSLGMPLPKLKQPEDEVEQLWKDTFIFFPEIGVSHQRATQEKAYLTEMLRKINSLEKGKNLLQE